MAIILPKKKGTGAKDRMEDVQNRIGNMSTRLDAMGKGDVDSRNWFEKLTNLPEKQNALFDILELIQRPMQGISNAISTATEKDTRKPFAAALEGIAGKKKVFYNDILEDLGMDNKVARNILGFGLDVGLDPTTYIPGAAIAKVAKGVSKGVGKVIPESAKSGIDTIKQGVDQMFGGKFAGLDEASKRIGKDLDASQRYLTDKTIKQTTDLHTEFGDRAVDVLKPTDNLLSQGQAVGRMQEKDLKIIQDAEELLDDILKGRNPRFNLLEKNSVNVVKEVNKTLMESPQVKNRLSNEFKRIKAFKASLASINKKQDIRALLDKKKLADEVEALQEAGRFDEILAKGFDMDDLEMTEQELKALKRIQELSTNIQKSERLVSKIRQGVQIRPVASPGKGVVLDNPFKRLFQSAKINKGDVLDNVSPQRGVDAFIPNGKPQVQQLIEKGKLVLPLDSPVADTLKRMFKEDISIRSNKNTVITLKNTEKYADIDIDDLTFADRISTIELPRPKRDMTQNADVVFVAKKLSEGNAEIRQTMAQFGLNIENLEGYMKHILDEELAKNASKTGLAKIGGNSAVVNPRNYKGSAEDVNELLGHKLFDTNAYFSSAIGRKKLIEYAHAESFKDQMLAKHGRVHVVGTPIGKNETIVRPKDFNFFRTEGGLLAASKAESYVVPKAVADALHNWKSAITNEGMNKFLAGYDKLHNTWKKFALFSAGFHIRNDLGNSFNMWVSGMRPDEVFRFKAKAALDLTKLRKIERKNNLGKSLTDEEAQMFKEYDNFLRQGLKEGSIFENEFRFKGGDHETVKKRFAHDAKTPLGKAADRAKAPFETSRDIGTKVDEISRYALYQWAKKKGMTSKKAADKVREVLFDYSDLSQLEHNLKRMAPFYTWARNNIPFQIKNLFLQPGKYSNVEKARQSALDITGMDDESLPEWYKEAFAAPVAGDGEGNGKIAAINLPLSDLTKLSNPAKLLTETLTPLLKLPIELGTNLDIFRGQQLQSFEGETEKMFGLNVPKKLAHALKQLGAVRSLSGHTDRATANDMEGFLKTLMTGNIVKDINAEDSKYYNLLEELNSLEDAAKRYKQKTGEVLPTLSDLGK